MNKPWNEIIENRWVEWICRWILGLIFIYAGTQKIISPGDFAKIIYGYDLFPHVTINFIAIVLPYIELLVGLSLISGLYIRSAALTMITMLAAFIIILGINLFRGHEFDCGCFGINNIDYINSSGKWIVRDVIFLITGLYVYFFKKPRILIFSSLFRLP